jgi:hypothetical protein
MDAAWRAPTLLSDQRHEASDVTPTPVDSGTFFWGSTANFGSLSALWAVLPPNSEMPFQHWS